MSEQDFHINRIVDSLSQELSQLEDLIDVTQEEISKFKGEFYEDVISQNPDGTWSKERIYIERDTSTAEQKIQKEYEEKAKNEESKFKELLNKLEADKLQTITNFTKETEKELLRLNKFLEEQKAKNKIESDQKRSELRDTINRLEDEKMRLVQQKNAETKRALDNIQQMYDSQARDINKKLEEYNKIKADNDKKLQDEMVKFTDQMKKLEEDKINKVNQYTVFTQKELQLLGKNLEEERLKAKNDGIKYKKELEATIEKLDKERMEIIKKKNDETAKILNKRKQEYEKEVESVNKSLKEYNDKKKEYDSNIKKIDDEQTAYVAKKRAESEKELGKLSKMLTDEIDNLKNKIEEHKVQRDIKLKEINELNGKIAELQKIYDAGEAKKATINTVALIGLSSIVVILIIYIFYQKNKSN